MPKNRVATWFLVSLMPLWIGLAAAEPPEPELKVARPLTPQPQPAKQPPVPDGEVEALGGRGVVVELVGKSSALEKAGLRPGDVVYRWRRLPNPPANPVEASGEFESPFDWMEVQLEQAPRSAIELVGARDGVLTLWVVQRGDWNSNVRPAFSDKLFQSYQAGQKQIDTGDVEGGIRVWRQLTTSLDPRRDDATQAWLLLRMAEIWSGRRQWEKAGLLVAELEAVGITTGKTVHALRAIGFVAWELREVHQAAEYFRRALDIYQAQEVKSLALGATLGRLGIVAWLGSDLDLAEEELGHALEIVSKLAPGSLVEARTLNALGAVARQRGNLLLETDYFHRALVIAEAQAPDTLDVAAPLNNLGGVAKKRGELDLAEAYYERALRIDEVQAAGTIELANTLSNLGGVAWQLGDLVAAKLLYQRALTIYKTRAPDGLDVADTMNNLGNLESKRGDLSLAAKHYQSALKIYQAQAPESLNVAIVLNNLGNIAQSRKDLSLAIQLHNQALQIRGSVAPDTFAVDLFALGRLARSKKDHHVAANYFERSLKTIEAQLGHLVSSRETEALFRSRNEYSIYREALSLQVELDHPEAAFRLLERSRAQSYLAMLAERELVFSDLPLELDAERRRLAVQYDRALQSLGGLSPAKNEEQIKKIQSDLLMLRQRQQEIQVDIRMRFPRLAAIQYPQPLDTAGVRQALDRGTVLLAYSIGEKESFLFSVSPESGLSVKRLSIGEAKLRRRVVEFRHVLDSAAAVSSLGNLRAPRLRELARELYALLVRPAEESLSAGQRVLLLADGPLHLLPFAALQRPDGQYFGVWRPLHTALSATVWAELKATRRPAGGSSPAPAFTLAAFGDPHYPSFQRAEPQTVTKGTETVSKMPGDFRVRAAVETGRFDWSPLPATRREVQEIARLFPEGSTRIFLGQDATEETAKALGREPRIVHFAAHGHLDDRFPWNSALALSIPESPPEGRDNGLLQVWEILESVRLDADLVVLSACETGLGEEQGGEGLIGLTRAFQFAGARSVLASLWSVQDQATSELMIRFYKHLLAGLPKDQALQAAQRELIAGPIEITNDKGERVLKDYSAPYYWAAFQLYGDWQ